MRILITGAGGMLGHALVPVLQAHHEVVCLTREDCDLCDEHAVRRIFQCQKPDMVVHLAAFTNVDACELEPEKAQAWNEVATLRVAEAAKAIGATVLYTSTDYVFDGRLDRPYLEKDQPNPLNVYGQTKWMGEKHVRKVVDRCFIVRTSWLFGPNGRNFVSTIVRLAAEKSDLRIVNDQRGSPTYTRHLAHKLAELMSTREYGIYHITGGGSCTWFEFAERIVELAGFPGSRVIPVSSREFGRPARRPAYSVLANQSLSSLGIGLLPHWERGLKDYLDEICEGANCADKTSGKQSTCSKSA